MKFTTLTPIKHDGKRLEEGATLELTKLQAERLLQSGAVAPFDTVAAKVEAQAKADAEAAEKAVADALLDAEKTAGKLV